MNYKNVYFVLPGGGSKGAFQWGAIRYLQENGITADKVWGVSVGALNAVLIGNDDYERGDEVWYTIGRKDVLKGWKWFRILFGKSSFYSTKPLYKLLKKEIEENEIKIPITNLAVSLNTGKVRHFKDDDQNFIKGTWASTAMPAFFEPVFIGEELYVDNGIRDISPLKYAIEDEDQPDLIVVISTQPREYTPNRKYNKKPWLIRILLDFLPITLGEIFLNDFDKFEHINRTAKAIIDQNSDFLYTNENGRVYKYYDYLYIEPEQELGSAIDFDRQHLDMMIKHGRMVTKNALEKKFN